MESIAYRGEEIGKAVASRIRRGINLYAERGHEIIALGVGKYRVPSASGFGHYIVDLEEEECQCADREGHRIGADKHVVCAMIFAAQRPDYYVEEAHNSCMGVMEYELVVYRLGIRSGSAGFFPTRAQAYQAKWELEGVEVAA